MKVGKKRYYFDKESTLMATGFTKIGKKTYCFNKSGVMQTGFKKITTHTYTYKDGKYKKKTHKYHYLMNKKGVMQTGFHKVKGKLRYFDKYDGSMFDIGVQGDYIISSDGVCHKLPKPTGDKAASERKVARMVAKYSKIYKTDFANVGRAAAYVAFFSYRSTYTMEGDNYWRAYGPFCAKEYSCAGSTRALGLVLEYMGFDWTHANANDYSHQWCVLKMDGKTGFADGQVGMVGYGAHPNAR